MNESDNLLFIAISQLGCLPKDSDIKSLGQISANDFARILLKICRKIISIKGIEISLPESLSTELNSKYRECQKIVDFFKHIGYKVDLNINNILFPSKRDIQRLFEFTIEYITNFDTGVLDYGHEISEKNYTKIKLVKSLTSWTKDVWLVPELKYDFTCKADTNKSLIKYDNSKLNLMKKKIGGLAGSIPDNIKTISQNKTGELFSHEQVKLITEEDFKLNGYSFAYNVNSNFIIEKLRKKNRSNNEKTTNQQFVELLTKRGHALDFIKYNYHENNFINNVKIIEKKNKDLYGNFVPVTKPKEEISKYRDSSVSNTYSESENSKQIYQKKIDSIMTNYEKEKETKNNEIKDMNIQLKNLVNLIEQQNKILVENENKKEDLTSTINDLSIKNENVIKEIEEKLETFEQIQKLNKSEVIEDELYNELASLEKKYNEMISNWDEYSGHAKSQVDELKNSIETKKKEYNFKYEKINSIKKEIDEMSTKIMLKQELANFLNEEYQKIPVDINRNKFISKISELTQSIFQEKKNIVNYVNDIKNLENQIMDINDTIKKVDNELEDKLYQDAKSNSSMKDYYASFIKIRDGYNVIQKNIIDSQILKNKLKEVQNKVEDYQQKLKSYDYNQLKDQVDLLKLENQRK